MEGNLDRRTFLKGSAVGAAAGAIVPGTALASHWFPPDPNNPPGWTGEGGGTDEGDVPTPSSLPDRPEPTVTTEHDRGDAVITRFGWNAESSNFGCAGDHRTGLVYVSQRLTDRVAVFDRGEERFSELHYIPSDASGAHAIKVDTARNRVWYAAGEASKIGALVLDPETQRARNFVEYTVPGNVRVERKPHGLYVVGDRVWYTDDRQDRVGYLDQTTGIVQVIDERIEADGIGAEKADGRRTRVWVAGGSTVTVIDEATAEVEFSVPIAVEPGFSQLRLHDVRYDAARNRVWVISRGSDHVIWLDPDDPMAGPQGFVNPGEHAAGLDHLEVGAQVWFTEGRANHITRHDPESGETRAYKVPVPAGYFNPHGLFVSTEWNEVWFTEREALCRLRLKDGGSV